MMLNISSIIRTTCATAPVCRIRLKISPPITAANAGAEPGTNAGAKANAEIDANVGEPNVGEKSDPATPPAMDANKGNCEIIIAKSTASIS
jgi:hypothetical protein